MSTDPRFDPPGPRGPGAGTGAPEPAAAPSDAAPSAAAPVSPEPSDPESPNGEPIRSEPSPGEPVSSEPSPGEPAGVDGSAVLDDGPAPDLAAETAETVETVETVDVAALQASAAQADEYLVLAQRTQADFENYRKRAARDAAAATQRGAMKLARELLPAVDNLERALEHAPEASDESEQAFVAGIKHVHTDLIAALQRAGIERYSPEGEPFDPTLHEAVAQQPFDGFAPGTVVEVFQRGYRIGESVVRPARVVVAG